MITPKITSDELLNLIKKRRNRRITNKLVAVHRLTQGNNMAPGTSVWAELMGEFDSISGKKI